VIEPLPLPSPVVRMNAEPYLRPISGAAVYTPAVTFVVT
jgi:hypothetical protein